MSRYLSLGTLNFGYDIGVFNGLQGLPRQRFGRYDPRTDTFALPGYLASIMNALPYLGKLLGSLTAGPIAEKYGRRPAVAIMACVSLVGVTLQTSATTAVQFTLGRVITYVMTGFCLVIVPIYQAECSPATIRGLVSSAIQLQIVVGLIVASVVTLGTSDMNTDAAWQIPVGIVYIPLEIIDLTYCNIFKGAQLIIPSVMLALLPFMPESPRWLDEPQEFFLLISKGEIEKAKQSLGSLRHKDAQDQAIADEMDYLRNAYGNQRKGSWKELFDSSNRTRTWIAIMAMFFQQFTGQSFIGQYSVSFYRANKIANPFLLNVMQNVASAVCSIFTGLTVDTIGRRPLLLVGSFLMASFLTILGSLGTMSSPSEAHKNTMAAMMILTYSFWEFSWAPMAYILVGEVSSSRVKEKTTNLSVSIGVIATFVVSFTVPYLVDETYAGLGPKVGFIYGGITFVSVVMAYLFIPELKGLSLEEVDQLFESRLPVRALCPAVLDKADRPQERIAEAEKGMMIPS
ncbi:hypothetical protein FE257_008350 [Aspergillus nanangensis]|uniref:Major facilitator superfamily (MFS) profile domain-containing protein n=1 Tax=Aspergillus nanangensis TaxID=2582783 RepID=A0AAD4CLK6_ASPNN|nr:hypothetical protein FE257_008350 [Aspergillus nanangensis]